VVLTFPRFEPPTELRTSQFSTRFVHHEESDGVRQADHTNTPEKLNTERYLPVITGIFKNRSKKTTPSRGILRNCRNVVQRSAFKICELANNPCFLRF